MLLKSIRLGSNDLAKSRAFYDATFGVLGVGPCATPDQYPIVMWDLDGVKFLLGPARDGQPTTHANGGTIMFDAPSEDAVTSWHTAALAHGGTCEGAPGARELARGAFGAYVRDPDGNKLGAYYGLNMG